MSVTGESAAPRGVSALTARRMFATRIMRPIAGEFLKVHAAAQIRRPLDRGINLVDEGVDLALRIAPPPACSLTARRPEPQDRVAVPPLPGERT